MLQIEVFTSPGCSKCAHAREVLYRLAASMGRSRLQWREVNILEELDHAVELGVLAAPAIAMNGELVFTGLPRPARLEAEVRRRLQEGEA